MNTIELQTKVVINLAWWFGMGIQQPPDDYQEEDEHIDEVELFGFLQADQCHVQELITGIRRALKRQSITPRQICGLGKVLRVLQRLPLSTPGVDICVSIRNESAEGSFSQEVHVTESSFLLLSGVTEYGPVGSDSYTSFSFVVEVGGFRDNRMFDECMFVEIEDWISDFVESLCDEEKHFQVDDGNEELVLDWDEEVLEDYWEKLDR